MSIQEYKCHNADILLKEDSTIDDLIDVIEVSIAVAVTSACSSQCSRLCVLCLASDTDTANLFWFV